MHTYPDAVDSLDDPVDQIGGKLQFLARIPAGGQSRSHKGAPVAFLRHDDLSQNRLVKLDEITTIIP